MPTWRLASTKYAIWPGSHCNCVCKPACPILCAFVCSSRSSAYASIHCGCPQELVAHSCSLSQWIVQSFFMKSVGMSAISYCLTSWSSGLQNRWTSYLYLLEMLWSQNLGFPGLCLKCIWKRDLKTFQQEYLLSRKFIFWGNSNYCGKKKSVFVGSGKDMSGRL